MSSSANAPEVDAILSRSLELTRAEAFAENEQLLRRAVAKQPDHAQLALRMGEALSYHAADESDARNESATWAERAAYLAPEEPMLLLRAASLLYFLGDIETSRDVLRQAHAAATEDFEFIADLLHLAGKLALARGDLERGEKGLKAAFGQDPTVPGHAQILAEFYIDQGRPDEAATIAAKGLEHIPDDPQLRALASG